MSVIVVFLRPLGLRLRKVRTPQGAMPRNPAGISGRDTRGQKVEMLSDGECHRKQTALERGNAPRGKGEKVG